MGIALANGDDQITLPFLDPPRELGDQRRLPAAGLAGHKADLAPAVKGTLEELPQLPQLLFARNKHLIGHHSSVHD
jgi:hypothetical protein